MSYQIFAIAARKRKVYTGEAKDDDEMLSLVARAASLGATSMYIVRRRRKRENASKAKE